MLAIGDALALSVAQNSGFCAEDFARNHPAGSLGLRFRSIRSEMRTAERLVCVSPATQVNDVMRCVSEAKTGAAILTLDDGTLFGIFTDGDLRRALLCGGQVLQDEVQQYATNPCYAIGVDQTLADAVKLFGQTRAEDLPVTDEANRVVGLICLKDISIF